MRKFNLLWSFLLLIGVLHAQSVTITTKQAGTLHQQITSPEKIKELTVKGHINRPDLNWLNSHCPQLMNLNLEEATIEAWNDPEEKPLRGVFHCERSIWAICLGSMTAHFSSAATSLPFFGVPT